MLLFSYGSNMLLNRLRDRIPSVRLIGTAMLNSHRLAFNKKGNDTSAKANAWFTGLKEDRLWGVVQEIDPADKPVLDRIESLGCGYAEKEAVVTSRSGKTYHVFFYQAMEAWIDHHIKPFDWYWRFVMLGALENELPEDHISLIAQVGPLSDPSASRTSHNQKVLEGCEAWLRHRNTMELPDRYVGTGDRSGRR